MTTVGHIKLKRSYVGRKFGRLVVKDYDHSVRNDSDTGWVHQYACQCDCGGMAVVRYNNLISGNTKSCGCLRKESNAKKIRINGKLWRTL